MIVINPHKSITELYADLLIQDRLYQMQLAQKTALCEWCQKPLEKHLPDERCSCYAMSREFKPVFAEDRVKVERALQIIEELNSL